MSTRKQLVDDLPKDRKENAMEDDPNRTALDRKLISLEQEHELRYWTSAFNCSEKELRHAMEVVGNSATWVREYLRRAPQHE